MNLVFQFSGYAIAIILFFAGIQDFKTRIVSNCYPLAILFCGLFTGGLWFDKALGLIVPFFLAVILGRILNQASGGADLKLYAALGFSMGLSNFTLCLFFALIFILLTTFIFKLPPKRRVPVYSYFAAAYLFCEIIKM